MDSIRTLKKALMKDAMDKYYPLLVETLCEFIHDHLELDEKAKAAITDSPEATNKLLEHEKVRTLLIQMALDCSYDTFAANGLSVIIEGL